jgi:hypothetical protein
VRARARTHARERERGEERQRERSGGVLCWRSEGAEYSAMAESAGFQGERESALFHPELSVTLNLFGGGGRGGR